MVAGCASVGPSPSAPSPGARWAPSAPGQGPTETATSTPGPSSEEEPDTALIAAARAYAATLGLASTPGGAVVEEDVEPDFDEVRLRLVSIPLEVGVDQAVLRVYFDDSANIRVVSDGRAFTLPIGTDVSATAAVAAAAQQFLLTGINPADGTLNVAMGQLGREWYITLDREIDGYPVANRPMWWGIVGDHAWVTLRRDGTLVELYAIRPDRAPTLPVKPAGVLADRLAAVAERTTTQLAELDPRFTWARATDPQTGRMADKLTLNYCATQIFDAGWNGWCVDAATGQKSLETGGID